MNKEIDKHTENLANERVETTRKRIAHALNLIEAANEDMKWACDSMDWNPDVTWQIDEAATKLGFALATLSRWHDETQDVSEV